MAWKIVVLAVTDPSMPMSWVSFGNPVICDKKCLLLLVSISHLCLNKEAKRVIFGASVAEKLMFLAAANITFVPE